MPSIINSDDGVVSGSSGLKSTGGNDGILVFQSSGTETARITSGVLAVSATSTTASTVRLYEDTDNGSNYVDLVAPTSVGSNRVITLPDATTTLVGTDTTQTLSGKTLTSPTLTSPTIGGTPVVNGSLIVLGTSQSSTSGSAIDFNSLPSWVKRITLIFNNVSTASGGSIIVQVGTGGTYVTSGYSGVVSVASAQTNAVSSVNSTAGFILFSANAEFIWGHMVITRLDPAQNVWVSSHSANRSGWGLVGSGVVTAAGALENIRVTTTNAPTGTFDSGTINIIYE